MKLLPITIILVLISLNVLHAQNYIGKNSLDIKISMKENRGYVMDDRTINTTNPCIKYIDTRKEKTLMFFLDDYGNCLYSKFMIDTKFAKHSVDTLTRKYKYLDNLTWLDKTGEVPCIIRMQNSDYFFTIIIEER